MAFQTGRIIREGKTHAVDRRRRHQRRQDQSGHREELDPAGAQLAQHVGIRAELVVREDLQIEPAIGLGLDRSGHLPGTGIERMGIRQVIGELVGELGLLGSCHQRRTQAAEYRRGGRGLQ